MKYPKKEELTVVFQQLSECPSKEMIEANLNLIGDFVGYCYGKGKAGTSESLEKVRFMIFYKQTKKNLRQLPPCKDSLRQHLLRSSYQSGWVWGNTLKQLPCPLTSDWGWQIVDDRLRFKWTVCDSLEVQERLSKLLKTCKCKETSKCKNCTCGKAKIPCIKYCGCSRKCV